MQADDLLDLPPELKVVRIPGRSDVHHLLLAQAQRLAHRWDALAAAELLEAQLPQRPRRPPGPVREAIPCGGLAALDGRLDPEREEGVRRQAPHLLHLDDEEQGAEAGVPRPEVQPAPRDEEPAGQRLPARPGQLELDGASGATRARQAGERDPSLHADDVVARHHVLVEHLHAQLLRRVVHQEVVGLPGAVVAPRGVQVLPHHRGAPAVGSHLHDDVGVRGGLRARQRKVGSQQVLGPQHREPEDAHRVRALQVCYIHVVGVVEVHGDAVWQDHDARDHLTNGSPDRRPYGRRLRNLSGPSELDVEVRGVDHVDLEAPEEWGPGQRWPEDYGDSAVQGDLRDAERKPHRSQAHMQV
mmetsp:Transcript_53445/g.144157  ORF Transcript_53445/g.144157 Transcript_53445/m.144157 type:complete len:357 (+) Transcript_53445:611-1681(+)